MGQNLPTDPSANGPTSPSAELQAEPSVELQAEPSVELRAEPSAEPLLARLNALEARVHDLEGAAVSTPPSAPITPPDGATITAAAPSTAAQDPDPFWALTSLKEHSDAPGAVVFAGAVETGLGQVEYQWGKPVEHLLAADWAEHADSVAALGHPLRLTILRRLLDGEHTVAQLVEELELGSTGVAYHHLSALQAGGWAITPRRGSWSVPVPRVVPLLAIITALEKG